MGTSANKKNISVLMAFKLKWGTKKLIKQIPV